MGGEKGGRSSPDENLKNHTHINNNESSLTVGDLLIFYEKKISIP